MKKLVSILLTLVMILAATSAFALSNISEIEGLPELPEVPSVYVKTVNGTTTVTLDQPVQWFAVNRNWDLLALEFDENNVASYSTEGQKFSAGFGGWGWTSGGWVWEEGEDCWAFPDMSGYGEKSYKVALEEGEEASNYFTSWKIRNKMGDYGMHNTGTWKETVHGATDEYPYGYKLVEIKDMLVHGGAYDTDAYLCTTNDGLDVRYDSHGRIKTITMTVTGQNFLGSETAPVESKITWTYGSNIYGKRVIYVSKITEKIDDETSIFADFASNGKCLRCR